MSPFFFTSNALFKNIFIHIIVMTKKHPKRNNLMCNYSDFLIEDGGRDGEEMKKKTSRKRGKKCHHFLCSCKDWQIVSIFTINSIKGR